MKLLEILTIDSLKTKLKEYLVNNQKSEIINIELALDKVLASDIYAIENTPAFNKSTVDGYAMFSQDSAGASESSGIPLKYQGSVGIGQVNDVDLKFGECMYVSTGAMLPQNADSVLMVEQSQFIEETDEVLVYKNLSVNENVTLIGHDIKQKTLLFNKGKRVSERMIATLISQGITKIEVFKPLKCLVISSGNELVDYQVEKLPLARVRDVNSVLIKNLLEKNGLVVVDNVLIKDDYTTYLKTLQRQDIDLFITSGGSSKGKEDYTYDVFKELTNNVFCHGLGIKPGKPTVVASNDQALYLGLPGNPVSAYLVLTLTLINALNEINNKTLPKIEALVEFNMPSSAGLDSVILVNVEKRDNEYYAKPLFYRSSNLWTLALADGYFIIDKNLEGVNENERVEVVLFE